MSGLRCQVRTGTQVEVPVEDLRPNDVILVSAGEQIGADGRVVEGHGLVDERMVRGALGLSRKQPDDGVQAGTTLRHGELRIAVLRHGSETHLASLERAIRTTTTPLHGSRTPTLHGETFAERTVAPTMAIAGLGLLIGDASMAAAVLAPDYASGPGLAFPLETLQAVALCIRHGIVVRDPEALDRLATADLLVLDHHPTLERTELELKAVQVFPGHSEDDLLGYAAAAFRDIDDERSTALRRACVARGITPADLVPDEFATDLTLVHGDDRIKVGDLGSASKGSSNPHTRDPRWRTESQVPESLMIGINGRVGGLIHFGRSTRLEATSALRRLRAKGNLQIGMVSDGPPASLARLAESLGVDFHVGNQSPDDRVRLLQSCRRRGLKVAYVGDCRNDPRTVAEAHVAISYVGTEIGRSDLDSAPVWLLQSRLSRLAELWEIARIHRRRIRVAHGYALIPNLLCVAGAFTWGFTSLASVVVSNLGTYGVYSRTVSSIRRLERQIARSRGTRPTRASATRTRANPEVDLEAAVEQIPFDGREFVCGTETGISHDERALSHNQIGPDEAEPNKIKDLPKEVGVMLLTAGIVGFILPGPGTPAIIAGGLVLWPEAFGKLESWLDAVTRAYTGTACGKSTAF